ncbi:MAG: ferritin-like domain-containing protein [Thermoproteota archaeon]
MSEPKKRSFLPEKLPERPEIRGIDPRRVVDLLVGALADEFLAYHQYVLTAYALKGHVSEELAEVFKKIAEDELNDHFHKLAQRLQDFDVDIPDFRDLWSLSRCKQPELPDNPYDVDAWLKAGIEAEECAIRYYREIYGEVKDRDPVTEEIVEDILADEVEHHTLFKNLLSGKA